ncbi:copper chaperone PCu(A)C [Micromonospora sp. NPDC005220]|uniref:copper chaperone PCu(A)C n=1 Tax=Micromonospora sp. NPDC005220 TaxID=3155589 RepID=UPI0033B84490
MLSTSPPGPRRRSAAVLAAAVLAVSAAGCGSSASPATGQANASASASANPDAGVLGIRDPWVKAADKGMTAAFGTLVNDGDSDVTLTSAATSVSPMELHEMAMKDGKMVMQAKQGGTVIKARSTHALEPVQGSYPFAVADPTSSAAPVANVSGSTPAPSAAAAAESDGGPGVGALVAGAALALVVLVTAGLLWRRAARPDQP